MHARRAPCCGGQVGPCARAFNHRRRFTCARLPGPSVTAIGRAILLLFSRRFFPLSRPNVRGVAASRSAPLSRVFEARSKKGANGSGAGGKKGRKKEIVKRRAYEIRTRPSDTGRGNKKNLGVESRTGTKRRRCTFCIRVSGHRAELVSEFSVRKQTAPHSTPVVLARSPRSISVLRPKEL